MVRVLFWAVLAAMVLALPHGSAQIHQCGDLQIIFKNPDLQPQEGSGFIEAQGQFFAQFQAIGDRADDIKVFGFSFGAHTVDFDETACDQPIWFTGQQIINYRADRDDSDGFFIPLVTPLVPDGEYTAAVHAYDAGDQEIARFWAKAIVDNCDGGPGSRCADDAAQHQNQDRTAPWPMVLPGDGQPMEGRHLSLEFAEDLSDLKVFINSQDVSANLTDAEPRVWDADYYPDYGPYGLGEQISPPCTQPYHTCMVYGPAYQWNDRPLTDADVVRVEATDLAGNVAKKTIHIGSSVAGGAITADIPILSWEADITEETVRPGDTAVFRFTMQNQGGAEGHPFAEASGPDGWELEWQPNHVVVGPGEKATQEFLVTPPVGTAPAVYQVNATVVYQAGSEEKRLDQPLKVLVGGGSPAATNSTAEVQGESKDGPVPLVVAFGAVAVAVAARRRR